jgi:hypothetical protein
VIVACNRSELHRTCTPTTLNVIIRTESQVLRPLGCVHVSTLSYLLTSSFQLHHLPGTSRIAPNEQDIGLARQFFEGNSHGPPEKLGFSAHPHLPPAELARIGEINGRGLGGVNLMEAWAREQQRPQFVDDRNAQVPHIWATEYGDSPPAVSSGPSTHQQDIASHPECE